MFDTLFDTLLGSVIILMAIGGIIFAFAVFIATLAIRIWRKHDVTAASTDTFAINHSGYAANNKLLDDVGELLKTGLRPPEKRVLKPEKVTTQAGDYWKYAPSITAPVVTGSPP